MIFSVSHLYTSRKHYLFLQGIALLISFILLLLTDFSGPHIIFLSLCVWNIITYLHLFYTEIKYSPDFHPFILLAIVSVQYIGINGISTYFDILDGNRIIFVTTDVTDMLIQGLWFLMLQHYLTFAGYFYIYKRKMAKNKDKEIISDIRLAKIDYIKWGVRSYLILWIFRLLGLFINWAAYSSIITSYTNQGQLITLTLLFYAAFKKKRPVLNKLFWIIVTIEIIRVLGHGMKEEIIINLIPYLLFLFIAYKSGVVKLNGAFITKIGLLGLFVLYVVFPYISIFRNIANEKQLEWSEVSISMVLNEYSDYILREGKYRSLSSDELNKSSTNYALSRAGSINCNAWLINRTRKKGTEPKYFMYCAYSLIPRAVWQNKPKVVVGNMMYEIALGHNDWDKRAQANSNVQTTALAPGFPGAAYMTFGMLGAIIAFLLSGIIMAYLWFFVRYRLYYNVIAIWLFYYMLMIILKDFEAFKDAGLVFYVMSAFYCVLIHLFPNSKYKVLS